MDWVMIGAVGQSVGAAAVVVSLVYVARQVRSATRESQLQTGLQVSAEIFRWSDLLAADGDMARIFVKGVQGLSQLEPVERVRFFASSGHLVGALELAFQGVRSGNWPDWSDADVNAMVSEFISFPGIQEWWAERRHFYSPAFAEHVDRVIADQRKTDSP